MRIKYLKHREITMILSSVLLLVTACNPTPASVSPTPILAPHLPDTLTPTFPVTATFTPPPLPTDTPALGVPCFNNLC